MKEKLGIRNNKECNQCGACCIYFRILEDAPENAKLVETESLPQKIFKEAGEVCRYLKFDDAAKKTHCSNYENRPKMCQQFGCYDGHSLQDRGKKVEVMLREDLAKVASEVFV